MLLIISFNSKAPCLFLVQGGKWVSFHIDDLQPQWDKLPPLLTLMDRSVSSLFSDAVGEEVMQGSGNVEPFAKFGLGTPDTNNQPEVENDDDGVLFYRRPETPSEETPKCDTGHKESIGLQKEPVSSHVDSLIRQCVHAAGAILIDPEDMKERKTERVQLLLQLLKPKKPGEHGKLTWLVAKIFIPLQKLHICKTAYVIILEFLLYLP